MQQIPKEVLDSDSTVKISTIMGTYHSYYVPDNMKPLMKALNIPVDQTGIGKELEYDLMAMLVSRRPSDTIPYTKFAELLRSGTVLKDYNPFTTLAPIHETTLQHIDIEVIIKAGLELIVPFNNE